MLGSFQHFLVFQEPLNQETTMCLCCPKPVKEAGKKIGNWVKDKAIEVFQGDIPLLPCITGSIAMIMLIKYRKSIAGIISSFFLGSCLVLPHFISGLFNYEETEKYFGGVLIFMDLHVLICIILFILIMYILINMIQRVYKDVSCDSVIPSLKCAFFLSLTAVIFGITFYTNNILILVILTFIGLPYLLYKVMQIELFSMRCTCFIIVIFIGIFMNFMAKWISVACHNKYCFEYINYHSISINNGTINGIDTIYNCDKENNKLCNLFQTDLKLQKEYYSIFRNHRFDENFDQICSLNQEDLNDMDIKKKGDVYKIMDYINDNC